jgi:hypothetical protein
MNTILLSVPSDILIDTVGSGTYGGVTIEQLVADNSFFKLVDGKLYIETNDTSVLVTGMVNGVAFSQTF